MDGDDRPEAGGNGATPLDTPIESGTLPRSIPCPFCGSADTRQFSAFGGQASTSQYYCNPCRTVFEAMRWRR